MNSLKCILTVTAIAAGVATAPAFAQVPGGQPGGVPPAGPAVAPTTSPYLNLANRLNNNPAINYYGQVRPQTQFASSIQSLQNQANQINPYATAASDQPVVTGNAFGFQNYRSYFQNQFQAGGFGNALSGGGQARIGGNIGASGPQSGSTPPRTR